MDRRELFQHVAVVATAAGLPMSRVTTAAASPGPVLAVIEIDAPISMEAVARLQAMWTDGLAGTPFEGLRLVVLSDGMTLTLLDATGHVLNRDLKDA